MIKNGIQPFLVLTHLMPQNMFKMKKVVPTMFYFGSEPPEEFESNWIKTNEDDGFFVYFRFYGPTESFFDRAGNSTN